MKVALFQGFDSFHYELLGFVIEYFYYHTIDNFEININIYTHQNLHSTQWKEFYQTIFPISERKKINWKPIHLYGTCNEELTFLLTDDDRSFPTQNNMKTKMIVFNHTPTIRIERNCEEIINVRPFCNTFRWVLPTYKILNTKEKLELISGKDKIHIAIVGETNKLASIPKLRKLFPIKNQNIIFHIMSRKIHNDYSGSSCNFVQTYPNIKTSKMFDILKFCSFVVCFDIKDKDYTNNTLSGAIPLSFSCLCRLIIPQNWNDEYKFQSPITYDSTKSEQIAHIELVTEESIQQVFDELDILLKRRNYIFDSIFQFQFQFQLQHPTKLKAFGI